MIQLSIIIPCLNEEHYIGKLLTSLSKQSFRNFEVIVIDGSSKDKTVDIVNEFITSGKLPSLKLIVADKRGVSHQRNLGAAASQYAHLLFLDADIQVKPYFLAQTVSEIEKRELDLATVDFAPLSTRVDDKVLYSLANAYIKVLQHIEPVSLGWCIFSTKKVHEAIKGFDENMKFGEDYDYVVRAAKFGYKLKVLWKGKVYISVRRLSDEGRLNYYKKAVVSEAYRFLNGKVDKELFPYEFGKFKDDVESFKFEKTEEQKQVLWKKVLDSLKISSNGDH